MWNKNKNGRIEKLSPLESATQGQSPPMKKSYFQKFNGGGGGEECSRKSIEFSNHNNYLSFLWFGTKIAHLFILDHPL